MTIDEMLDEARARLDRIPITDLEQEVADGAVLVDIRPLAQREADGEIPEALVIDSNVLLWRLAPSSSARQVDLDETSRVIVFCNEGYTSSLVAAQLHDLDLPRATDLIGGYQAWRAHQRSQGSEDHI